MTDAEPKETRQRYRVHPLTRSFAYNKSVDVPEWEQKARERWSNYYLDFAHRHLVRDKPKERYWNSLATKHTLPLVDPEWPNFRNVLAWVDQKEQYHMLIELMMRLVHYMDRRVLFSDRIYYVRRAAEAAHRLEKKVDEATLRIDGLGWTLIEEDRLTDAEKEITAGLHIAQSLGAENVDEANDLTALAHAFLARVYLRREDLTKAATEINKAMLIPCRPVIQSRLCMIAGDIAQERGDYPEAIKLYRDAIRIGQEYEDITESRYRLGFAYLGLEELAQAEVEFNKVLMIGEEQRSITIETIYAQYGLAHVAKARNEIDQARWLAQEASAELSRLHPEHRLLNEIDDFLKHLEAPEITKSKPQRR